MIGIQSRIDGEGREEEGEAAGDWERGFKSWMSCCVLPEPRMALCRYLDLAFIWPVLSVLVFSRCFNFTIHLILLTFRS